MADRSVVLDLILRGRDLASAAVDHVRDAVGGLRDSVSAALEPLRSFAGLITAVVGIGGAKELIDRADAYTNLSNQVKVATKDEADYQASIRSVAVVAKDANADLDSTARLYGKVKQNADSLGISQQQVADVTGVVAKGMQLSGAEAGAAAGATLQFTQALGSGVLRGEEFNSVIEASPALIKAIADGLGVTVGEMRGLAEAGQLTSDRVVQALLSQKQAIDETYARLPQTVGQAMGQLDNAATIFVGRLNEQLGATQSLNDGLKFLATNLDAVAALMGAAFAASVAKGAQSTGQFVTASIAARDAARQQAIAAEQQQAANIAAAQSHVAAAQAAYNRALAEQRATQAQLASLEALAGLFASEEALAIARGQATAAANAAAAATQRYAAAQAALNAAQGPAAASVGIFSRALAFLAGPGGLVLAAVSAFGLLFSLFSNNKQTVDDLTLSTDQYADALKKMNAAQASAALLKVNDALADQRRVVSDLQGEVDRLNDIMAYYQQTGTKTDLTVRALTEANGKLADANDKLRGLEEKRADILKRVNEAQQESANANLKQVTAYNQLITALDKVGGTLQAREKYLKQVSDAEIAETQALIDKAKALGNTNEVERLTIEIAQQRAKAAQQAAGLAQAEANAEEAKIATLEKLRDVQGQLTPGQQKSLALAQESAVAKHAEADAAQALADKLALEAQSQESGAAAKQRAVEKAQQIVTASGNYLSALEAVANAEIAGLRAEIDLANAKGETAEAVGKGVQLAGLEAKWAQALADAKQAEIVAEKASVEAKIAALQATNSNAEATQKEIAALQLKLVALGKQAEAEQITAQVKAIAAQQTQQNTQQTQKNTEETEHHIVALKQDSEEQQVNTKHTNDGSAAAAGLANRLQELRGEMDKLSESARLYFEAQNQWNLAHVGIEGAAKAARDAQAAFQSLGDSASRALAGYNKEIAFAQEGIDHWKDKLGFATTGFEKFESAMELAALQTKKLWNEQARDAEIARQSIERMTESGNIQMGVLQAAIRGVNGGFTLLDQQDLSGLQSAIDAANAKLRQMQQEAEDARANIARLNAEIAAEQGDTEKANLLKQQLDYQQALADIEAKRNQAVLEGNRELVALYDEQIRKLNELNALKEKNIKADAKSNSASSSSSANNSRQPASQLPGGTGAAALPATSGGGGITVNVNASNARVLDNNFVEDLARQMQPALSRLTRLNS